MAPAGPTTQDFANAKAMSDANTKAQWWTSALVLVAFGRNSAYYFGRPVFSFLKTMTDEVSRGRAVTTDPNKKALM